MNTTIYTEEKWKYIYLYVEQLIIITKVLHKLN